MGSGVEAVTVSNSVDGLSPGVYHYRLAATNSAGTTFGDDQILRLAPVATTAAATSVKAQSATLNGTVNPNGLATTYQFEYGPTTSYGTKVPATPGSAGSGTSGVAKTFWIGDLSVGSTYHYRIVATNSGGTTFGEDRSFTTLNTAPVVSTGEASSVQPTSVVLNGTVNPGGLATTFLFEYGTTPSYGSKIPLPSKLIGSGTSDVPVSEVLSGLAPGTTYHYRVIGSNAEGTIYGEDRSFSTPHLPPSAMTKAATTVKSGSATLNGAVNPNGVATSYQFEYGPTASYGTKVPAAPQAVGAGSGEVKVSQTISGLEVDTVYHYRLVAQSTESPVIYGEDMTLEIHAPRFEADGYPATLAGESNAGSEVNFTVQGQSASCKTATLTGTLAAAATTVDLVPSFTDCVLAGTNGQINANGCALRLQADSRWVADYTGSFGVACPEGKAIEFTAGTCALAISPQSGLKTLRLAGQGNPQSVGASLNARGVKYTITKDGFLCPFTGTGTVENGTLAATATVHASSSGKAIGLHITGEEERGLGNTVIEAEEYPATLSGEQENENKLVLSAQGNNSSCKTSFAGTQTASAVTTTLTPTLTECGIAGFLTGEGKANGCAFVLHASERVAGGKYSGNVDVTCPGSAMIEITSGTCAIAIPAQSGKAKVELEDVARSGYDALQASFNVSGFSYTVTKDGFLCPFTGTGTFGNGTLSGTAILTAKTAAGALQGVRASGKDNAYSPRVEADEYPATLSGEQENENKLVLSAQGNNSSCKTSFAGTQTASAVTTTLTPTLTECGIAGFLTGEGKANGCAFVLHASERVAGGKYSGNVDVTCPGSAMIEITSGTCAIAIPAQSGKAKVELEDVARSGYDALQASFNVSGFSYTVTKDGFLCPFTGTGTFGNGTLSGTAILTAKTAAGALQGVRASGG